MAMAEASMLDAAGQLLAHHGVPGLTLSAVAELAGVSRVTLHRRGLTIDDLIEQLIMQASVDLRAALWDPLTSTEPANERLKSAVVATCAVTEKHLAVLSALFHVPEGKAPPDVSRTQGAEIVEAFDRLLRDGQSDQSLFVENTRAEAEVIAASVTWTYVHLRRAFLRSEADSVERMLALIGRFTASCHRNDQ